ncbi:MAG TPA: ABC transporter ATP-binding protein [Gryllotalpicola sp.]
MSLLEVRGITKSFGGIRALRGVTLDVEEGQILGVIGANGAGKTTLFNCITGAFKPDAGTVTLAGRDITGTPSHRLAALGMARTFQLMRPFHTMNVLENVAIAVMSSGVRHKRKAYAKADAIVARTGLEQWETTNSGSLPAAIQKRLELARALALEPRVLLLDEVLAGLVPSERIPVMELLEDLRTNEGVTMVFIEHIMAAVRRLSDSVVMMDQGAVLAAGDVDEVLGDPKVIEAYLGEEYARAS